MKDRRVLFPFIAAAMGCAVLIAASPAAAQTTTPINACVSNRDGSVRISSTCNLTKEAVLIWNQSGPQGPAGPMGPTGLTGATGPMGPTGLTGPTGPAGPTGPMGPTGLTGATGPMGPTGLTGATGPMGPTGLTGATGPVGPTGPMGPQGPGVKTISGIVAADGGTLAGSGFIAIHPGPGIYQLIFPAASFPTHPVVAVTPVVEGPIPVPAAASISAMSFNGDGSAMIDILTTDLANFADHSFAFIVTAALAAP